MGFGLYSDLISGLVFGFEIRGAGRVVADLNCSEERFSAMFFELLDLVGDLLLDLSSYQSSIHSNGCQFLKRTLLPSNFN